MAELRAQDAFYNGLDHEMQVATWHGAYQACLASKQQAVSGPGLPQ